MDDAGPDHTARRGSTIVALDAPIAGRTIVAPEPAETVPVLSDRGTIVATRAGDLPVVAGQRAAARGPESARASGAATTGGPVPLVRGARLGRWILEDKLGEGATASVWSARHEHLGAPVAIKIFHRLDLPFHTVLGEARAAAGIPSRNAIWVYDVDTFGGHRAIVMERCAETGGGPCSLKDADVGDPREAARLLSEAARGVQAAHDCGVFHKDVKPANILRNPSDGRAQITDFGLANPALWTRPMGASERTAQSTVCVDGTGGRTVESDLWAAIRGDLRLGTPEFMAPEQAGGLRRDLDPTDPGHRRHLVAIDVYGLGATLWFLLAGRPPFPRVPDPELTPDAIMADVVGGPPCPLAEAAPRAPRRLVRIVEKAIARDPFARYPTAAALADDLDAWLAQQPTSIDRGSHVRAAVHLWRERARVGLLAALAVVTIGSSFVVAGNARRIGAQTVALVEQRAELARVELERTRALGSLAAAEDTLQRTRDQLQLKDGLLVERGQALAERDERLASASVALTDTREALSSRGAELDGALHRLARLELARTELEARLAEARTDLDRVRRDREAARAAAAAAIARGDGLRDAVIEKDERIAALERSEERARQKSITLDHELTSTRQETLALREEVARLRGELSAADARPPLPEPSIGPAWQHLAPATPPTP